MTGSFTLQFWRDDAWYVGRLKEVPSIFSQGRSVEELRENIRDAYEAMFGDADEPPPDSAVEEVAIQI